uniref:3,4-dihydroxy-2-butanone-4-phosphate synthase n=1 Tax=Globisporangium ultimum (strain ATCC 200006 / CBS 805.95 / DAOM BR144) TaxID=431595 RepID=K3X3R1_GLOUD
MTSTSASSNGHANGNGALARNAGTSSIEEAIEAMKAGKFVAVMDNEDRENEGDLIMAAEFATEEAVAFMLRHTTGIICVPALKERIDELQLPLMVENNTEVHKCKFTITVDLREGNSTGVSAADRARTIRALADSKVQASAFNRPGHIFPLVAQDGGVLVRAGHTEAATDLSRLAGSKPIGYICEMNDENGRMMRRPQLEEFAIKYDVPLITISDLIRYRVRTETLMARRSPKEASLRGSHVVTPLGQFAAFEYKSLISDAQTYEVLVYGGVADAANVPVYFVEDGFVHSVNAQWAQQHIVKHGAGILIYVNESKKLLEISGELMARQSIFGMGMQIVKDLQVASVTVLSTEEKVAFDPQGFGVSVTGFERLAIPSQ